MVLRKYYLYRMSLLTNEIAILARRVIMLIPFTYLYKRKKYIYYGSYFCALETEY